MLTNTSTARSPQYGAATDAEWLHIDNNEIQSNTHSVIPSSVLRINQVNQVSAEFSMRFTFQILLQPQIRKLKSEHPLS